MANKKPKILYLDIENSRTWISMPVYGLKYNGYIHPKYVTKDWYITAAAWGWLDNTTKKIKGIKTVSGLDDMKAYKKDYRNDLHVCKELHKVIQEADLIIGHNVDSFDIKKINYRFAKHKLPAIDLPPTVDTLKAARKYMKATSNSLYYLAKEFGLDQKIQLAPGTMHEADEGCAKSLKKLVDYNKGDIKSGAGLYFEILPRIKNHPNINKVMGLKQKSITKCGSCGSNDVIKNGYRYTKNGKYQRLLCGDCGSSTRGKKITKK